jgi:ATP-dependent DNA helicase RecG
LAENQKKILMLITDNPRVSKKAMAQSLGISTTAIDKNLAKLKQKGILRRVGPAKEGHWEMIR